MKSYKSNRQNGSKKGLYSAIVFVVISTLLIVGVSIKRSLSASKNDSIVKINSPNSAVSTSEPKYGVKKAEADLLKALNSQDDVSETKKAEEKPSSKANTSEEKPSSKMTTSEEKKPEEPKKKQEPAKNSKTSKFVRPLEGKIVQSFSGDNLVYSKTLGEFRTHNGIDIEALPQTPVKAVADGTVVDLFNDEGRWGTCVEIKHDSGLVSIYRGLDESLNVKLDSKVKAGEIIGVVGKTNAFEGALEPHLHLEMKKGEDFVDPLKHVNLK